MRHTPVVIAQTGPYTWDDFVELDDDDRRELIDGDLVEVEVSPTRSHEHVVLTLGYLLLGWVESRGRKDQVLASAYKVRIAERRGVMPDLQFYREDNPHRRGQNKGMVDDRPDLAVEVISPSSRRYDRVVKLGYYQSVGVPEYWIVDPEARTVEQLILTDGFYTIAQVAAERGTFSPKGWEGLEIPLARLWDE